MIKQFFRFFQWLFAFPCEEETIKVVCDADKCTLCGKCQAVCSANAIAVDNRMRIYYGYRCQRCAKCVCACASGALSFAAGGVKSGCLIPAFAKM